MDATFYEFFELFKKAMNSRKEEDWKAAQRFACRNQRALNLSPKVAALLIAGPI